MSKGNMYDWITDQWNPIGGECPHKCSYCYVKSNHRPVVKKKYTGELRPIQHEFEKSLGSGKFIFVCSMVDLFADEMPDDWILRTLGRCLMYDENKYLFQTKNPRRMMDFQSKRRAHFPEGSILGTTIETNRHYSKMGNTVYTEKRAAAMSMLAEYFKTMVTVEPIMDFDVSRFRKGFSLPDLITICHPEWVNIGADSKGHNLPEPSADKIKALIDNLRSDGIEVKIKSNLKRITGEFPK